MKLIWMQGGEGRIRLLHPSLLQGEGRHMQGHKKVEVMDKSLAKRKNQLI